MRPRFLLRQYPQPGSNPGTGTTRPKGIILGTALIIVAILLSFYVGDLLSKKFERQRLELSKEIIKIEVEEIIEREMEKNKKELEAALEDVFEENERLREQLALPPMRREGICITNGGHILDLRPEVRREDSYVRGYTDAYVTIHALYKGERLGRDG